MITRILTPAHLVQFEAFRLFGLSLKEGEHLADSFETEACQPLSYFLSLLTENTVMGAFAVDGALIGVVFATRFTRDRLKHRATLWGQFVHPNYRGMQLGCHLLSEIMRHLADRGVTHFLSAIVASNTASRKVCAGLGFEECWTETRGMGGADVVHIIKYVKEPT